jgi:hypothetical protein
MRTDVQAAAATTAVNITTRNNGIVFLPCYAQRV